MQRDRRRCPGNANRRLAHEIIECVPMLEDPGDERRVGELMEYAYWPGTQKADRLVIVAPTKLERDGKRYLKFLSGR